MRTPYNFETADLKISTAAVFNDKILSFLNKNHYQKTSFINNLDWHRIRIHVSSFLNSNSGLVFLGNIRNTNTVSSIFEGKNIAEIRSILTAEISSYFPEHKEIISFDFITINHALIAIIKIKVNNSKLCFYDIESENTFYYRTKNGITSTNKTLEIVNYTALKMEIYNAKNRSYIDLL